MNFLGKEISGMFTIPSGIITTKIETIERLANEIPELGVVTTKSIGLEPKEGNREPIFTQYKKGSFMNAVGLANPGAEEFAEHLKNASLPKDKFLLTSIFGKDADEFVKVAKILSPYSDGLELNLSCPHDKGHGMAVGQDPEKVKEITQKVKESVDIPVIPKLTPNVEDIRTITKAAVEGGADGICAINTYGPGEYEVDGNPVLSNVKGGKSGKDILPIGLECIKKISEVTSLPIIGTGGISSAKDVKDYQNSGATITGIGSALTGTNTEELKQFFHTLNNDLSEGKNNAQDLLKDVDMSFKKYKLKDNKKISEDLSILTFEGGFEIKPGQFVFMWIPGVGEKPFSVLDDDPLTIVVRNVGCFTEKAVNLEEGQEVYFRGPYGQEIYSNSEETIIVCGGTGMASLYKLAKKSNNTHIFFGAKNQHNLFYQDKLKDVATLHISTEDGSEGHKGMVTDILKEHLENTQSKDISFFNCGPPAMIKAANKIQQEYSDKIYNSIDYITKCGVGICGSCSTENGKRSCVDGPFLKKEEK